MQKESTSMHSCAWNSAYCWGQKDRGNVFKNWSRVQLRVLRTFRFARCTKPSYRNCLLVLSFPNKHNYYFDFIQETVCYVYLFCVCMLFWQGITAICQLSEGNYKSTDWLTNRPINQSTNQSSIEIYHTLVCTSCPIQFLLKSNI